MQPQLAHLVEVHRSEEAPNNAIIFHVLFNPETQKVKIKNVFSYDGASGISTDLTDICKELFPDQLKEMVLKTNWNVIYNANKHLFL